MIQDDSCVHRDGKVLTIEMWVDKPQGIGRVKRKWQRKYNSDKAATSACSRASSLVYREEMVRSIVKEWAASARLNELPLVLVEQ